MIDSISRIRSLAIIILIDGIRRYALIGLLLAALAAEAAGLLFFDFIPRDIGRASTDFIFSVSWVAGVIFLFFHCVHVMAWDEERRIIHTLLSRPISRSEYVLGVFSGLGTLLLILNLFLGVIGWGTLILIKNSVSNEYFNIFSNNYYIITWLGLFAIELMLLAVIMLFSGMIRGGFPVLLVSLCYYLICSGLPVVRTMVGEKTMEGDMSKIYPLLKWMTMIFPDLSRFDLKNAVVSADNLPQSSEIMMNFGLAITYIALVLWLGCSVYKNRDLQ
jgi:ABC-type transport system involved in multi-copper enzyme maturation permease subunit